MPHPFEPDPADPRACRYCGRRPEAHRTPTTRARGLEAPGTRPGIPPTRTPPAPARLRSPHGAQREASTTTPSRFAATPRQPISGAEGPAEATWPRWARSSAPAPAARLRTRRPARLRRVVAPITVFLVLRRSRPSRRSRSTTKRTVDRKPSRASERVTVPKPRRPARDDPTHQGREPRGHLRRTDEGTPSKVVRVQKFWCTGPHECL
jgi:hypothetical protein